MVQIAVLQSMDFRKTLVCSRALPKRCMESAQGLVQAQSSKRDKGLDVQTVVVRALSTPIDSRDPMPMCSPIGVWANHSFCGDLWRPWCTWPIPKAAGRYGRESVSASGYRSVGMVSAVQASSGWRAAATLPTLEKLQGRRDGMAGV